MKFYASLLAATALVLPLVVMVPSAQAITLCKDNTASGTGEHDCRLHGGWKLSAVVHTGGPGPTVPTQQGSTGLPTAPAKAIPQQGLYSTSPLTAVGQEEKKIVPGSDTCNGQTLTVGATCTVTPSVRIKGTSTGAKN